MTTAGIQVGVIYTPPGPGLAKWAYEIEDKTPTGRFDRVAITTSVPCRTIAETTGAAPTMTPAAGPTKNWVAVYAPSVVKTKLTISCDAAAGGTATVDVLSTAGASVVTRASFSVLGPK
uniref:hypothetical protein n=1 Tax=Sphingomonas bacterium TaxID=1895847 RepID=UPI002617A961|nr:hypothetical protein [Sphingomonas bacterium]